MTKTPRTLSPEERVQTLTQLISPLTSHKELNS